MEHVESTLLAAVGQESSKVFQNSKLFEVLQSRGLSEVLKYLRSTYLEFGIRRVGQRAGPVCQGPARYCFNPSYAEGSAKYSFQAYQSNKNCGVMCVFEFISL